MALRESLVERHWLQLDGDGCRLSAAGRDALKTLNILAEDAPDNLPGRWCLDWTERRHHIGGALGRELAHGLIERVGWLRAGKHRRALRLTPVGLAALPRELGIDPQVALAPTR